MSEPVIQELEDKIVELEQVIEELYQEKETVGMSHSKQSQKNKSIV